MIVDMVRVLVRAGATPVSAARAAYVLDSGGTIAKARAELVYQAPPSLFDAELLVAEAMRELERVRV